MTVGFLLGISLCTPHTRVMSRWSIHAVLSYIPGGMAEHAASKEGRGIRQVSPRHIYSMEHLAFETLGPINSSGELFPSLLALGQFIPSDDKMSVGLKIC